AARVRLVAARRGADELPDGLDAGRPAALLRELADRDVAGDRADPALLVVGRVRRLAALVPLERAAADLLHDGEPAAAAGDPHAALPHVPAHAPSDLALGQRPLLRLVHRPDRDQRRVPDGLL